MVTESQIPPLALAAVVRVFDKGSQKDDRKPGDWKEITDQTHWYNKAYRHICEYCRGQKRDLESSEPTLAHAIADLMILLEHELKEASDGTV